MSFPYLCSISVFHSYEASWIFYFDPWTLSLRTASFPVQWLDASDLIHLLSISVLFQNQILQISTASIDDVPFHGNKEPLYSDRRAPGPKRSNNPNQNQYQYPMH